MKNDIVSYELGTFIDFKSNERLVVACAVSQSVDNDSKALVAKWVGSPEAEDLYTIIRVISIGIAVYNAEDPFSLEQGKELALKRAYDAKPTLFITQGGVFNKATTSELLKKAIENFSKHPETIITGYIEAATKYADIKKSEEAINVMSEEEMKVVDALNNGVDVLGIAQKALPYLNATKNGSTLVD